MFDWKEGEKSNVMSTPNQILSGTSEIKDIKDRGVHGSSWQIPG